MGATADYATRLAEALNEGMNELLDGAVSYVFPRTAKTYVAADLPRLEVLLRYLQFAAAESAITNGAQEHTILGRTFKRADLAAIQRTVKELRPLVAAELGTEPSFRRTGIRMRQGIPLG